ncbi:MAG: acyl-ACP--UDP-N-acetylglucosamine O-acyltransferase [Gammaproteobacteria bacterium]
MIDSRAVIDPGAQIDSDVSVGPFVVIGAGVEIEKGTWIGPNVVIEGPTRIGRDNKIFPFAVIGGDPQDRKYGGEDTRLEIGDGNVIREYCSISRGTAQDQGVTRIGDDNWIMAYVHIAHDCRVGAHTVFANNATLAGHVEIEDYATLGGFTLVHQFCRIGAYAFSGMGTAISKDVPPNITVNGSPARARCLNTEGLARHGFGPDVIQELRQSYKTLYRSELTLDQALFMLRKQLLKCPEVARLIEFLERPSRGVVR